jgi:acid stress-induced BolA-like protein IbaG/YrbA
MFSPEKIQHIVEAALPGSRAAVRDLTGGGDHFELIVVAVAFEGKGPVDRHRMVYSALGSAVGNEIHALALKTLTPAEAEERKV